MERKGYYVFLSDKPSAITLIDAFESILGISKTEFLIINGSIVDYIDEQGNLNLGPNYHDGINVCECFEAKGDFVAKIELGVMSDSLISELSFAKKLSQHLSVNCLISSKEINPYHWIFIDKNGNDRFIYVDQEKLDDHNEFVVAEDA